MLEVGFKPNLTPETTLKQFSLLEVDFKPNPISSGTEYSRKFAIIDSNLVLISC